MSTGIKQRHAKHPMETVHGEVIDDKKQELTREQWHEELGRGIIKRKDEMQDATIDLALRVLAAQESLEWSVHHFAQSWHNWGQQANERLKDLRMWRMAFDLEVKTLLRDAADIRQFFLDDKHIEEVKRLKEFVELCERLKALKQDGTLDAVMDSMLKLAT